ncbi:hypothetical protein [Niallia sp. 03190]|uniref:hypothetical protein n=1 Tax=Niallia sp. 03190 TaxID=3458061 RepID=UPI0040450D31
MNQSIILMIPGTETDDYSRPVLTETLIDEARVQYSSKVIERPDGTKVQATLEVDLMPDVQVKYGTEAKYENGFGEEIQGSVISIDESTNLAGTKVFFRTVLIG